MSLALCLGSVSKPFEHCCFQSSLGVCCDFFGFVGFVVIFFLNSIILLLNTDLVCAFLKMLFVPLELNP